MIGKLARISSVSEIPECITPVLVDLRAEPDASVVHGVGHARTCIGRFGHGLGRPSLAPCCLACVSLASGVDHSLRLAIVGSDGVRALGLVAFEPFCELP